MRKLSLIITAIILLLGTNCTETSKLDTLKNQIKVIIDNADGTGGISIKNLETNDTLSFNNNIHYPMQSVYKSPLAFAVLNRVDKGEFKLNQAIHISKNDLLPDTWSPLREKYPDGNIELPLSEIINYTVSQSDNNGCDILFRLIGGTKVVDEYIHGVGINEISIQGTEEEIHKDWNVQFTNWCKPYAMIQLLEILYQKKTLSDSCSNFLWKQMVETSTGPNRLKGLLPKETIIAHKTGSSGKDENGITAAVNDIGIIKLPNGQHVAIVVFVSNSKVDDVVSERVIAEISKKVFDFYNK